MTSGCRPKALTRAAIELSRLSGQRATRRRRRRAAASCSASAMRTSHAEFNSETARIDLNAAPKELLCRPVRRARRAAQAGRLLCGPHHRLARAARAERAGREPGFYRAAGLLYSPRGAPFQHVAELGLVLGIPEVMVERAMPYRHRLFGPAADQHPRRGAAGARRAARDGSGPAQRDPGATRAPAPQNAPSGCWRCSVPRRRSRTRKAARRCG